MKILLINGSGNSKGCTYTALYEMVKVFEKENIDAEIIQVDAKTQGCIGCGACRKIGKCAFGDNDKVNEIGEKLKLADGIVVGSPVHYAAASGMVTSFMDRLFYAYGKSFAYKPAASIVSCRRGGAATAFDQLNKYFSINNMPIVPSQYWNQVHGSNPDEVRQDEEGMQTMRTLAQNMAWMIKCFDLAKKQGIEYPVREAPLRTNFIG